jgi:hypothetical protein
MNIAHSYTQGTKRVASATEGSYRIKFPNNCHFLFLLFVPPSLTLVHCTTKPVLQGPVSNLVVPSACGPLCAGALISPPICSLMDGSVMSTERYLNGAVSCGTEVPGWIPGATRFSE